MTPAAIEITSFTRSHAKLEIIGRATSNDAVVRYQQTLLDSGAFRDVLVVSMSTTPPTPTPQVTSTPTAKQAQGAGESIAAPFGNVEFVIDMVVADSVVGSARP